MYYIIVLLVVMTVHLQARESRGKKLVQISAEAASQALKNKPCINQELKDDLLKMEEEDQIRRMVILTDQTAWKAVEEIDRKHNPRLKEIVQTYGWPGIRLVGIKGTSAMWLLVQHQDLDVPFQKECLVLLKEAVDQKDASFRDYAYLLDRVCKNENLPQVYGTQWLRKDGKITLYPVEDFDNLNQRRALAGLCSIEEYLKYYQEALHLNGSDFK